MFTVHGTSVWIYTVWSERKRAEEYEREYIQKEQL